MLRSQIAPALPRLALLVALGVVLSLTHAYGPTGTGRTGTGAAAQAAPDGGDLALAARTCVRNRRGLPSSGAYAGSVVSGKVSLAQRERYYGRRLPIHRTYFGPGQWASAVRTARNDVAHHRLPWMSFKVYGSWKQNARGKFDGWARALTSRLNRVPGPVWLAFYHEPENKGQDVRQWTRMQARFARFVKRGSNNIATTMIVMGWHQVSGNNPAYKLNRLWPGDGLIDVLGMDPYNFYGTRKPSGAVVREMSDFRPWFRYFHRFARAHHTRWGVAETAYNNQAASRDPAWIVSFYRQLVANGGVAMAYFDTTLHTGGYTWNLDRVSKRAQHRKNIRSSIRIC